MLKLSCPSEYDFSEPLTGQAKVWLCDLDPIDHVNHDCLRWLDDQEKQRFEKFASIRLKNRFLAAHAFMRYVLAQYLNVAPQTINFDIADKGKPSLCASHESTLHFSLSHSHNQVALLLCQDYACGVDIEYRSDRTSHVDIAKRFFNPNETSLITQSDDQADTFYQIWVRKEAVLKTYGHGIGDSLDGFDVSLVNTDCANIKVVAPHLKSLKTIRVYDLKATDDYALAISTAQAIERCDLFQCTLASMPHLANSTESA